MVQVWLVFFFSSFDLKRVEEGQGLAILNVAESMNVNHKECHFGVECFWNVTKMMSYMHSVASSTSWLQWPFQWCWCLLVLATLKPYTSNLSNLKLDSINISMYLKSWIEKQKNSWIYEKKFENHVERWFICQIVQARWSKQFTTLYLKKHVTMNFF
jgi:hypothetical protein